MNTAQQCVLAAILNRSTEKPVTIRMGAQGSDIVCSSNSDRQRVWHALMRLDLVDHVVDWEERTAAGVEYVTTWRSNAEKCKAALSEFASG